MRGHHISSHIINNAIVTQKRSSQPNMIIVVAIGEFKCDGAAIVVKSNLKIWS